MIAREVPVAKLPFVGNMTVYYTQDLPHLPRVNSKRKPMSEEFVEAGFSIFPVGDQAYVAYLYPHIARLESATLRLPALELHGEVVLGGRKPFFFLFGNLVIKLSKDDFPHLTIYI